MEAKSAEKPDSFMARLPDGLREEVIRQYHKGADVSMLVQWLRDVHGYNGTDKDLVGYEAVRKWLKAYAPRAVAA